MTFRFDGFTLDAGTRQLLRQQTEVHLSPKAFDLLLLLVEHRSRAVPKADLLQSLWPTTFVLETNLASLIAEIRRALEDTPDDPRYIRTMHRFGYWFIGAVQEDARREAGGPAIRYWLVWEKRQIALNEGESILGRAPDAAVWIDAPGVSRQHARIRVEGSTAMLEDLGSKNGTYVGARQVTHPLVLTDGDQIRLGSVVVTFRIPPPAASTDTVRG